MISDDALAALKERNPVDVVASQWVALRTRRRGKYIGPCPVCSEDPQSRSAMRFECNADAWVCAVCQDGGDVIKLVMKREVVDFKTALDRLGGAREEVPTPALARRAGLRAHAAGEPLGDVPPPFGDDPALRQAYVGGWSEGRRRAAYETFARNRERDRLIAFWKEASPWPGTLVEKYLAWRGLVVPDNARLRCHPALAYLADGREVTECLHRGPAMLAPIQGTNGGLHMTWLAADGAGKADLSPAKKVRGSKAGGYIDLGGVVDGDRLVAGEGIETVLAGYTALVRARRNSLSRTMFRAGIDLGNLAGKALSTVPHPTLKTARGQAQRVPGPEPDLESPAMPVPDHVTELVLLGDGDSDPFLTRNAMERARARHMRPGLTVRVIFPDESKT
ncbi:TPA: CHC2 zinc finger domain-containing protein [Escherichia coli]